MALKHFDEADCWGKFSASSVWKSFQRACAKLGLEDLRPYDLRHSFGSAVYAATGDPLATQQLMGHGSPQMTARYTLSAVPDRLTAAVGAVNRWQQPEVVAETGGSPKLALVSSRKQTTRP